MQFGVSWLIGGMVVDNPVDNRAYRHM